MHDEGIDTRKLAIADLLEDVHLKFNITGFMIS
jgi:hypothetical protein